MLTIFSTPKPFRGHAGIIQRNAIKSWSLLHPDLDVILFGDDEGATEVTREIGIRHEPRVLRNGYGTKYLNYIFDRAHEMAKHDLMCYVNCDIILMSDFMEAVKTASEWCDTFLMVGHRWDIEITEPWDFERPSWEGRLRNLVLERGKQHPSTGIDYFVFSRGMYYKKMPSFVIGRPSWDNWLIWKARSLKIRVADATAVAMVIHQNHDYSYHPQGEKGVWHGEEAKGNYESAGGFEHLYTLQDATHRLTSAGVKLWLAGALRLQSRRSQWANRLWHPLLSWTRSLRHNLGLKRPQSGAGKSA